jgi:hypothetical protein
MKIRLPLPSSAWKRGAALIAGAAGVARAPSAHAVEREQFLGANLGGSALIVADKNSPDIGPALGAHWGYGMSDEFNLMVEAAWSLASNSDKPAPKTPATRPSSVWDAEVGVGYVFDVLSWVPYAGLLVGADVLTGGTLEHTQVKPDFVVALGLDYRFDRHWAVGAALRQHVLLVDSSTYPSFTQAFARCEYTWGW